MNDNVKKIIEELKKALAADAPDIVIKQLELFIQSITLYLNKIDNFYISLRDSISTLQQYQDLDADTLTASYALFKLGLNSENNILEILKEGYLLIDSIREQITKEKIVYRIATEKKGQLYEQIVGIDDILANIKISYESRATLNNMYKIRLAIPKQQIMQQASNMVAQNTEDGSTLYSAIHNYINNQRDSGAKINRGQAYEVYRLMYYQRGKKNRIPPSVKTDEIVKAFNSVKKNTASYIQGGDLGDEQIKYIGKTMPSLTTTATIRSTLTSIKKIFENYLKNSNSKEFQESLEKLFLKKEESLAEQIDKEAYEKAKEEIERTINQLKIK